MWRSLPIRSIGINRRQRKAYIKKIEKYINAYLRKQFGGKSADEVYKELFT